MVTVSAARSVAERVWPTTVLPAVRDVSRVRPTLRPTRPATLAMFDTVVCTMALFISQTLRWSVVAWDMGDASSEVTLGVALLVPELRGVRHVVCQTTGGHPPDAPGRGVWRDETPGYDAESW